jgi:hypothetical protein
MIKSGRMDVINDIFDIERLLRIKKIDKNENLHGISKSISA